MLSEITASGMTFTLTVWTLTTPDNFSNLRSDLYIQILRSFQEQNIEVPFPQMDLHLHQTV